MHGILCGRKQLKRIMALDLDLGGAGILGKGRIDSYTMFYIIWNEWWWWLVGLLNFPSRDDDGVCFTFFTFFTFPKCLTRKKDSRFPPHELSLHIHTLHGFFFRWLYCLLCLGEAGFRVKMYST